MKKTGTEKSVNPGCTPVLRSNTAEGGRMNTDSEETLDRTERRERRMAAKERKERKGSEIPSAGRQMGCGEAGKGG
jgi:hypothetical protein